MTTLTETRTETKALPNKFSPVSLEPVVVHGVDTGKMSVILDDPEIGKFPSAIVGKNYGIWSNYDAVKVMEEVMHRSKYSWSQVHEIWDGKHLNMFWKTEQNIIELPEVGDAIQLGVRLENSYDGSCKLRIAVMAYVLKCTNGMVSDQNWGVFSVRHDNSRAIDWGDASGQLEHGVGNLIGHTDKFKAMSAKSFNMDSLLSIAGDTGLNSSFLGKYVKALANTEKESYTQWDALNVGTDLLRNPESFAGVRQLETFTNNFLELASSN